MRRIALSRIPLFEIDLQSELELLDTLQRQVLHLMLRMLIQMIDLIRQLMNKRDMLRDQFYVCLFAFEAR